jgi:hypothetical protein
VGDIGDKKGKTIEVLPASDPVRDPAPVTEPASAPAEPASPTPAR